MGISVCRLPTLDFWRRQPRCVLLLLMESSFSRWWEMRKTSRLFTHFLSAQLLYFKTWSYCMWWSVRKPSPTDWSGPDNLLCSSNFCLAKSVQVVYCYGDGGTILLNIGNKDMSFILFFQCVCEVKFSLQIQQPLQKTNGFKTKLLI